MTPQEFAKRYPNFDYKKLACKCGKCGPETGLKMDPDFMDKMQTIRTRLGAAMVETSGYRCPNHPEERKKSQPGAHATGHAMDVTVANKSLCDKVVDEAYNVGMTGKGIKAKNGTQDRPMIHLDDINTKQYPHISRPMLWTY